MGKIFDGLIVGTTASMLVAGGIALTHGSCGYYSSAWKAVKCEDAYNKVVSTRIDKSEHNDGVVFSNISEEEIKLSKEIEDLKDKQNGYARERIAGLACIGAVCAGLYVASGKMQSGELDTMQEINGDDQRLEDESILSYNAKLIAEEEKTSDDLDSSNESHVEFEK